MKAVLIMLFLVNSLIAQNTQITILHTGDSHSHLDAFGPKDVSGSGTIGGIGKAATIIGTIKATEQNVLFVHSGDFSVGDFFYNKYYGVPELQILKQLGCDALTVGNHEFDLGPTTLYSVFQESFQGGSFPVLSANLDMSGYPELGNYVSPYVIKDVSGVKVGIFGMTIPSPLSNPSPVVIQENIPEITYATVTAMQSAGADVVVMLSHLGWSIDSSIAAGIPGINIIVGGHDHYVFNSPKHVNNPAGYQTYVLEAGENYEYVGKLDFTYSNGAVTFGSYTLIHADANVPSYPEVQGVVDYLKQGIVETYGDVYGASFGTAKDDINRVPVSSNPRFKDSPVGNLITDAYRYKTKTETAITANGLISQKIYKGAINGSDIFHSAAYGYDVNTGLGFNLLKMDISGMELIKGLEVGLSQLGITDDYFLQVSGISFRYNPLNDVGSRIILSSLRVSLQPVNPARNYSLTVNEGLYGILLQCGVMVENVTPAGLSEYAAVRDYISSLGTVKYTTEGRISEKEKETGKNLLKESGTGKEASLYGNFPNPFNPVTKIQYYIPVNGMVTLKVYDVSGREIKTLVNEFQKPGAYTVAFDGSSLSSGAYFCRLITGGIVLTKRMMLVK